MRLSRHKNIVSTRASNNPLHDRDSGDIRPHDGFPCAHIVHSIQ